MRIVLIICFLALVSCTEKPVPDADPKFKMGQKVKVVKANDWLDGCTGTIANLDHWTYWKDKNQYEPKWVMIDGHCPDVKSKKEQPNWLRIPQRFLVVVK